MNSTREMVNAAASAVVLVESRRRQFTAPRRRWNSIFNLHQCFGCHQQTNRIIDDVLVPEPARPQAVGPPPENPTHPSSLPVPVIAPPSSPVSFHQSVPPSATQSPACEISFFSHSNDTYSPDGRPSIFAIGPYANETQLVSPPAFSAFTTEPSTEPFTPPPESVHFTTPTSPEVPFAKLLTSLDSNYGNSGIYPASPIGRLIPALSSFSSASSHLSDSELRSLRTGSLFLHDCKPSSQDSLHHQGFMVAHGSNGLYYSDS